MIKRYKCKHIRRTEDEIPAWRPAVVRGETLSLNPSESPEPPISLILPHSEHDCTVALMLMKEGPTSKLMF